MSASSLLLISFSKLNLKFNNFRDYFSKNVSTKYGSNEFSPILLGHFPQAVPSVETFTSTKLYSKSQISLSFLYHIQYTASFST